MTGRLAAHVEEIAEELRVKQVVFGPVEATGINVRPNLKTLGPRLGGDVNKVRQALAAGDFEMQPDGSCAVAGYTIAAEDLLVERTQKEGWAVASSEDNTVTVAFDTTLTDDLRQEARVYELIHAVNGLRKDRGFEISDRIELTVPDSGRRPAGVRRVDQGRDARGDARRGRRRDRDRAGLAGAARRSPWRCAARGSRRSWRPRSTATWRRWLL